ncbi:MAG TPA: tetratricopeptide repeat protein, partial [Anaerolineae bacterium]
DILVETGTLVGLGYTAFVLGSYTEARAWFTESIGLSRARGATYFLAMSESMLALVAQAEGAGDALTLAQAGLEDSRLLGYSHHGLTTGLWALSCILHAQGKLVEAHEAAREALQLSVELQHLWARGTAKLQLGAIALAQGDAVTAQDLVQESVNIFTELGEPWSLGRALVARGWVAQAQHQHNEARSWFEQALNKARALQLDPIACSAQYGLAYLIQEEAPAAALVFLEQVINHQATERTIRDRAIELRQALIAAE